MLLLPSVLDAKRFRTVTASGRATARQLNRSEVPELILLDVVMSGHPDLSSRSSKWRGLDNMCSQRGTRSGRSSLRSVQDSRSTVAQARRAVRTWLSRDRLDQPPLVYGGINLIGECEYLTRNPWSVGVGPGIDDKTVFLDIRYVRFP